MRKFIDCIGKFFRFVGIVFIIALCAVAVLAVLAVILPDNFMQVVNFLMGLK